MPSINNITSPLGTSLMFSTIRPGPTIVVVGGHHGDEPAGSAAAGLLASYAGTLDGSLVIVPQANPLACALFSRFGGEGEGDLNRCYDLAERDTDAGCEGALHAAELLRVVLSIAPAAQRLVTIDLHETSNGHSAVPPGHSVWCYSAGEASGKLIRAAGLHLQPLNEAWQAHTFMEASARRGAHAIAVETVKNGPLGARIELQMRAVVGIAAQVGVDIQVDWQTAHARIGEERP